MRKTGIYIIGLFLCLWHSNARAQFEFIENRGQWDAGILYRAQVPGGYLHLEKGGFNWFFYDEEAYGKIMHGRHAKPGENIPQAYNYHVLKMDFVNARPLQTITPASPSAPFYNYYYGKNPDKWATGVKGYYQLQAGNVWPGVDLKLYNSPAGLKYDFIVQPNTAVNTIQLQYRGQEAITLSDGKLLVKTSVNTLIENIPEAYQYAGDKKIPVQCRYTLQNGRLGFETGPYDKNLPLVIDPILIFVTYSGSTADNFGFTATYDSRGNLYAGGNVTSPYPILPNGKYPTTPGAFQQNFAGRATSNGPYSHFPCDIVISKYDSSGHQLLYATYIGGTDNEYPHSLVADNHDNLVMLGSSYSEDFPILKTCYDTAKNGSGPNADIVLVKFNSDGTALLGSTFMGGAGEDGINAGPLVFNYADNFRGDVLVDIKDNIYVASCSNSGDFPVENAAQGSKKNGYDGVVFCLDGALANLQWSTYLGGSNYDALYSIQLDDNDNVIVGGGTGSNDLAVSSNAMYKTYIGGSADGYVAVLDSVNHQVKYLTYFGSTGYDQVYFVDIDKDNHIYLAGQTTGNIPLYNVLYGQAGRGQFITKFNKYLDTILFSTTIGNRIGNPDISPTAFLVDNCDNIYFSGWGSDIGVGHAGSTNGLPVTPGAIQSTTDGSDFWIGVLTPGAQSLYYATFIGGTQTDDHVDGGTSRFDKRGVIYQSICGSCPNPPTSPSNFVSDMPTTPGAVYQTNLSPRCSNTSIKLDFQIAYAVDAKFEVTPILGCLPLSITITDHSFNAKKYSWDFGDGSPVDTTPNPVHTYTTPGKYRIKQVITNPLACNFSDSFFRTVEVIDRSLPEFSITQKDCETNIVSFSNQSSSSLGYLWRFGDGATSTAKDPVHTFPSSGSFSVTLITSPGTLCEDSLTKTITLKDFANSEWNFPNVFTPGGKDTLNDCFIFGGLLADCDKLKLQVFNRWGELVWETTNPEACWDGKHLKTGQDLPAGVYFVTAEVERLKGKKLNYTGTISLLR